MPSGDPAVQVHRVQVALGDIGARRLDEQEVAASHALMTDRFVVSERSMRSEVLLPRIVKAAAAGLPVHVITSDEPRAHTLRYEWKDALDSLGLTCDVLTQSWEPRRRRETFLRQVVFGSHQQFCADAITSHAANDPARYWPMPMAVALLADASDTLLTAGQNLIRVTTESDELAGAISVEGYLRRYPHLAGLLPPVSKSVLTMVEGGLRSTVVRLNDRGAAGVTHSPFDAGVPFRAVERDLRRPLDEATWAVFHMVDRAMSTRPFLPLVEHASRWLDEGATTPTNVAGLSLRCDELGTATMDLYARRVAVGSVTVAWSRCLTDLLERQPAAVAGSRRARRTTGEFTWTARSAIDAMIASTAAQGLTFLLHHTAEQVRNDARAWADATTAL